MCTTFALAPVKVAGVYASYPTPLLASRYSSAPSSVKLATLPRDLTVQESWSGWIGSIKDVNNKELIDSISSQHVTVRHAVRKCEDRLGVRIHTRNVLPFPDRVIPAAGYRVYSTEPTQETSPTTADHAGHTAPTRQHELNHTDHTDHTDQEYICPAWQISIMNCTVLLYCCSALLLYWE